MRTTTRISVAMVVLLGVFAPALPVAAQQVRYRLIDIPTLGGPTAIGQIDGFGISQYLNNSGIVVGGADTAVPDPNCFSDCFVTHAFRWQDGVLTDLGALGAVPGQTFSHAMSVNGRGWATGGSFTDSIDPLLGLPQERAVLWKDNAIVNLGTLGGVESAGEYVTNGGQVVGFSTVDQTSDPFAGVGLAPYPSPTHTFVWKNGVMQDVGTLGGPDSFTGGGCNNQSGSVVGSSFTSWTPNATTGFPTLHAYLWDNGKMHDIPTLGGSLAIGQCGNNQGQVIGVSTLTGDLPGSVSPPGNGFQVHPFLWDGKVITDLGTLGGDSGQAFWINDTGDVVGVADLPGNAQRHAFLWRHGTMTDLKTLGGSNSRALAINSQGQIIGRALIRGNGAAHAFLWENGGPMVDLNSLIPQQSSLELIEADNINDRGEIVGRGLPAGCDDLDSCGHVFLLIPCVAGDAACQSAPAAAAFAPTTETIRLGIARTGTK